MRRNTSAGVYTQTLAAAGEKRRSSVIQYSEGDPDVGLLLSLDAALYSVDRGGLRTGNCSLPSIRS